ncbi:uncharacterized protein LOC117584632 [Drosophila guanche]|uniref:DUF4794 domain-containing protein n=1 Tax=Drosophila guanche TaxID=7266 RepID=A0A3B0JJC4_DROGU|nr:uncharacterized protein LOC117584632 [Drosophila guanche]SPP82335.1 Hypothetical predicted protein [Drosophila guanche]
MIWKTFTLLPLMLLLAATTAASYLASSTTTEKLDPTTVGAVEQSTLFKEEEFPAMAPAQAAESSQPILLQPPPISGGSGEDDALRRRTVTYDQRQEGQYNIRADLENFMILLIPPGPQDGLSLLDILSRGASTKIGKRKSPQRSPSLKSFYQINQLQRLQQHHQQQLRLQQPSQPVVGLPEFIEGRTPYHVDISASDTEQAQRLQRQQVDVLPPQLIHMPQLIKPFHLEAEPELIQALPPVPATSTAAGSNLLESYNQPGSHYFRNSRALRGDSYLETNRLAGGEYAPAPHPRSISVPIYRSELSGQANALYPPIDAPAYVLNEARGWQLDEEPTQVEPKHLLETDIISFDLLSDDLGDSKTLLRDGLARCARGERRDSYGACRQIEGY